MILMFLTQIIIIILIKLFFLSYTRKLKYNCNTTITLFNICNLYNPDFFSIFASSNKKRY